MPIDAGYLADRSIIAYAPSVSALLRAPETLPHESAVSVVAIHSPELPKPLLDKLKATAPSWLIRSGELAAAEVNRLDKDVTTDAIVILEGADATRARLQESSDAAALHLAAPFRVNTASPLFSPILLTPLMDQDRPVPGQSEFELRELFNVERLPPTVMLSDPAALSKRDAAAAVGPVAWAWRAAGATTLILRRWGGDEASAGEIVATFHQGLHAGKSPVEALNDARTAVRRTDAGSSPAAWAGWLVLIGK
jgi:hypothetical protein